MGTAVNLFPLLAFFNIPIQGFIQGRGRDKGALQDFGPLGIFKLVCKHINLDCCPPKIFNAQFLPAHTLNEALPI